MEVLRHGQAEAAAARSWVSDRMRSASPIIAHTAWDALSAAAVRTAGASALVLSGASLSASRLGLPDLGFLAAGDIVPVVRTVFAATGAPILADIDTGFGDAAAALAAAWAVYEAGAVGVIIEDQEFPKRCGLLSKAVVSAREFQHKVAVLRAGLPDGFLVVARTDALAVEGFDAAAERAAALHDCGADLVYVQGVPPDRLEDLAAAVPGPKHLALPARSGAELDLDRLAELGFLWITRGSVVESAVITAIRDAVAATDRLQDYPGRVVSAVELGELFALEAWSRLTEEGS